MEQRSRTARRLAAPLAAATLCLGMAACSDDDGNEDDIDNPVDGVDDQLNEELDELDSTEVPIDNGE